ncbi:MAG: LytTR family DNA-binding domain-containing protein [Bacteroidetes bacterium]|nr:LytTR family DNA-binding domain-containing protein [Bacteroidota bacterium]MBU1578108.1 LytTR family DNA-binding domain-containing protein [Bacteroidota bacterium]MBU2557904.1 LytTR family DNA-binding domain-containing protein [Bacteroidota bacterium]
MTDKTNLITSIIIDDEPDARERMTCLLEKCEQINNLESIAQPSQAIEKIRQHQPDLLFIDVEMPGMSGFDLVQLIHAEELHPHIVFVTGYSQYAIKAIKAEAFDFLLKPVDIDELRETIQRVEARLESADHAHNSVSANPLQDTANNQISAAVQRIKFSSRSGYVLIDPAEILYCEADGAYTIAYLKDGRELTDSNYLSAVENRLPQGHFVRISRSLLVNLAQIIRVDRKKHEMAIRQGNEEKLLQASKRYFSEIDQYFS